MCESENCINYLFHWQWHHVNEHDDDDKIYTSNYLSFECHNWIHDLKFEGPQFGLWDLASYFWALYDLKNKRKSKKEKKIPHKP